MQIDIPGVDVQQGIAMTGGMESVYRTVLSFFCKDVETRLPMLQAVPDADSLLLFVTYVHAIKSASTSIGAADMSARAKELEAAGKAGDLAFIQEKLGSFAEDIEELAKNIKTALENPETENQFDSKILAVHNSLLTDLGSALKSQNAVEIDRILEELMKKELDSKTKELLEQISDDVLMAEYDNALKKIKMIK